MAITATPTARQGDSYSVLGQMANNLCVQVGTIAFDSVYAGSGGEAITITGFTPTGMFVSPTSGYVFEYDVTNKKVIAYGCSTGASAAMNVLSNVDLSGLSQVQYLAWGYS